MIGDKIAIFIDTNVFERRGFNFDKSNQLINQFKTLLRKSNYEYFIISVIDQEVKQHIMKRRDESFNYLNKYNKWVFKQLDNAVIEANLNKNLLDYEKFKEDTDSIFIDLSDINSEIVLKKYFDCCCPFEHSKPYEFKDAFFLEAIFKFSREHELYSAFMVVTEDKGVKNAIKEYNNPKIISFNSIEDLLDSLINYSIDNKKKVFDYISKYDFTSQIISKANIVVDNIKEADINIGSYNCAGLYFPKILKVDKNKIILICDLHINLIGKFSCLDEERSFLYDGDEEVTHVKFYIDKDFLGFVCQTVIEVSINDDKFVDAKIIDLPDIFIDYESFLSIDDFVEREM